ncbi:MULTISPECIES: acyl-CoA dehydrogenase [unclassified Pseudomonas]|uniref:acyl-CoA dehydrogenase n=1 Tax=unclassified Pseudomonas TaxID=196821 RepID=UPI002AC8D68C|nr:MULTISPECIES: acyl-CoA dehydrogenase [unclassified Pseudomonas]MEB0045969.1 acyl-CoA dehydrogenase [Pseudomonas sp. Dout3]MEB0097229.1 acyl-CoA dehydrogenase [Pseudomonas sp. DC1.2]WPX56833.1 acyl-CoA dehydrogenase [Pseudomonas sp. DC1.2]
MNALTQSIGQSLTKSQHDLHNARSLLEATVRFVRQQPQVTAEPYVISRVGDVHIRIDVAAALLERAESFLSGSEDDAQISIAVAESHLASADALNAASNAEFEFTGQRTGLPGSLHDPLRWKLHLIGNFRLNGIHPSSTGSAV